MVKYLRIIHNELRDAATDPANPMSAVAELERVYTSSPGFLTFNNSTDIPATVEAILSTGIVWFQDILSGYGIGVGFPLEGLVANRQAVQGLIATLKRYGVTDEQLARLILHGDWEAWNTTDNTGDFEAWYKVVRDWPGLVGNYGNSEGEYVASFLRWDELANVRGVNSPTAYSLSLTVSDLRRTLAISSIPRWAPRKTVVFIKDPVWYFDNGRAADFYEFLAEAGAADYIVFWGTSPQNEAAYASFNAADRLEQDQIIAGAIGLT